ncbi:maltosaccharide ABC transporter permease [Escherichia coli]|uniref:Maltosaccharide ABC transporter permease n=1 Tax=Escherichia coli TaxID=562 RepID=A0A376TFF1_ECOLX|nr:maltosaccharide ABC transporter permease [Escherichia coli]
MDKFLRKISTLLVYLFLICNSISCAWASDMDDNASFKKGNNLFSSTFSGIEFTFDHYITLFTDTPYMQWY